MKIKNILICFIILKTLPSVFSQYSVDLNINTTNFTLAQPDVSNFEKYSLNPVNYYIGKPIITIPIINIKSGNIDYPIKLGYDSGGIKVDQIASNVGLGWNLSSTILTRTVNQDNDFDNTGCLMYQADYNTYSALDATADFNARKGHSGKVGYFLQKQTNMHIEDPHKSVDYIPDVYHFYTNGFSTSFFFNDENTPIEINPQGSIIQAVKSKQKFEKNTSLSGIPEYTLMTQDFFTIYITTKDNIKYTFSDCDISFNQDIYVNDYAPGGAGEKSNPPAQVSAWHITKIEDLKTLKKIEFFYENRFHNPNFVNQNLNQSFAQRNFEFISEPLYYAGPPTVCWYPTMGTIQSGGYYLNTSARIDHTIKYLRKIIFDEGQINFKYSGDGDPFNNQSGGPRFDIYGGEYLEGIVLKNKNLETIKNFKLGFNYFQSDYNVGEFNPDNANNPYRYKRLKLISFEEVGNPSYKFSYYENKKLPPINSFAVDFLGYSNNSVDATNIAIFSSIKPKPTLYYYPNRFEKSLLAFPIQGLNGTIIPGYFDRKTSNDINVIQAWSLKKIEYPTGGSSEYFYESNIFEESGQNIKGGGIRINQQKINDGLGSVRTLNYSYLKENSTLSSGKLSSIPFFGHPTETLFPVGLDWQITPPLIVTPTPSTTSNTTSYRIFGKSNLNVDINSGSYVGYSRIVESEVGKGRKEMLFSSNNDVGYQNEIDRIYPAYTPFYEGSQPWSQWTTWCFSDFIVANSGLGSNIFTDNSFKRGKILNEKIFDEFNNKLTEKSIIYNESIINAYSFYQSYVRISTLGCQSDCMVHLFSSKKDFKISRFLPQSETISTYDTVGNHIDQTTNYTYTTDGFIKTVENLSSNGDANKTEYNYPTDVTTSLTSLPGASMSYSDNWFYRNFVSNNRTAEIIQTNYYKNNILNSYKRKTFWIFNPWTNVNDVITLRAIKLGKGNEITDNEIYINENDTDFNTTQYTTQNGTIVSVIWGYNKTKIIAKIENLEYSNLPATSITNLQTLSNADFDHCRTATCKEQLLRNALNTLRTSIATSYPNARVTTYTFDPLVGVTSVTDPKTDVQYYTYDTFQRLIKVEDKNGKILSENEYNYKLQN